MNTRGTRPGLSPTFYRWAEPSLTVQPLGTGRPLAISAVYRGPDFPRACSSSPDTDGVLQPRKSMTMLDLLAMEPAKAAPIPERNQKSCRAAGDPPETDAERRGRLMAAVETASPTMGTAAACAALGVARASVYRRRHPARLSTARPTPPRALDPGERQAVLETLHSERFLDQAPAQVHATLLDEGTYLCSPRTMYRLLDAAGEVKERRDQVRRPHYAAPRAAGHTAQRSLELVRRGHSGEVPVGLQDPDNSAEEERSGPRNLDSGLSEISIVFQAAVPKLVASKYTTSGVRRPSEL